MTALRYEDLLDVADVAQHWYAGQGDPVYALVSSVYAGHDVPLSIAEDALSNLERDHRQLKVRRPEGWRKDYDELGRAIDELQFAIHETRSQAALLPNPVHLPVTHLGTLMHIQHPSTSTMLRREYHAPIYVKARHALQAAGYIEYKPRSDLPIGVQGWSAWRITPAGQQALADYRAQRRRAALQNPLAMGDSEKIAICFGLAAGLGALLYYALATPAKPVTVQV